MDIPLLQHQKQHILLVACLPKVSSLNLKMSHGDRWEHWQKDVRRKMNTNRKSKQHVYTSDTRVVVNYVEPIHIPMH